MHPKLHQIAGQNPNINFVRVEYNEELGKALSIRMLPFAQFHGPKGLHEAMAVSLAPKVLRRQEGPLPGPRRLHPAEKSRLIVQQSS